MYRTETAFAEYSPRPTGVTPLTLESEAFDLAEPETGRPDYAPTPLESWKLVDEGTTTAFSRSIDHIESQLEKVRNFYPESAINMVEIALYSSIAEKYQQNNEALAYFNQTAKEVFEENTQTLFEQAKRGAITPAQGLHVATRLHGLPSLELAKLSHPGSLEATRNMDTAVNVAIDEVDPNANWRDRSAHRRYSNVSVDTPENPSALIFTRKRDVALVHRNWLVVKKSDFVIRLDNGMSEQDGLPAVLNERLKKELAASVSEKDREERLQQTLSDNSEYIEAVLGQSDNKRSEWLLPTSTSYYCKNLSVEADLETEAAAKRAAKAARESLGWAAVQEAEPVT